MDEEKLVTTDKIINWLTEQIEHKNPIDPHTFVDAAMKLNLLRSADHDKLFELQKGVAMMKVSFIDEGKSSVEAKTRVEATDSFHEMKRQEGKLKLIEEAIRLAKIQSRLANQEFRGN